MAPGVSPACCAMRGIVVPSTPCCPRTSAVAFCNLRSDSRLRSCCGASVFFAMENIYTNPPEIVLDNYVNVTLHLHITEALTSGTSCTAEQKRRAKAKIPG